VSAVVSLAPLSLPVPMQRSSSTGACMMARLTGPPTPSPSHAHSHGHNHTLGLGLGLSLPAAPPTNNNNNNHNTGASPLTLPGPGPTPGLSPLASAPGSSATGHFIGGGNGNGGGGGAATSPVAAGSKMQSLLSACSALSEEPETQDLRSIASRRTLVTGQPQPLVAAI
jgi:hypothetical protein